MGFLLFIFYSLSFKQVGNSVSLLCVFLLLYWWSIIVKCVSHIQDSYPFHCRELCPLALVKIDFRHLLLLWSDRSLLLVYDLFSLCTSYSKYKNLTYRECINLFEIKVVIKNISSNFKFVNIQINFTQTIFIIWSSSKPRTFIHKESNV